MISASSPPSFSATIIKVVYNAPTGAMNLSLTPEIEQRIADQLNQGHYQSAQEVILAALELLDQRQQYLTELRQEIAIGATQIEQGQVIDGEQVCDYILNRLHNFFSTR